MIREGSVGANGTQNNVSCPDPNRWLGVVFGMTARGTTGLGSSIDSANALEVYPLWDYFREHELEDATLSGWWDDVPAVTVGGADSVKATAFIQRDNRSGVIAVGNFGNTSATVTLSGALIAGKTLIAGFIEAFQPAMSFAPGAEIQVTAKRGWLLNFKPDAA